MKLIRFFFGKHFILVKNLVDLKPILSWEIEPFAGPSVHRKAPCIHINTLNACS